VKDSPKEEFSVRGSAELSHKPISPEQPTHTSSKKRKVEEVADSQDEDSDEESTWTDEATINTNQP
jgi:hypothetical protein